MKNVQVLKEQVLLGKEFRVYGTVEEPLFVAKDVAEWIDYSKSGNGSYNLTQMLKSIDEDEKLILTMLVGGQNRQITMLTEDGLYEVLMQSRKPIAKEFKKEVKKILKEIRKTGGYIPTTPQDSEQDILAKAYIIAQNKINNLQQELKSVQPLIDYANVAQKAHAIYTVTDIAKIASDERGIMVSNRELYEKLRNWGLVYKNSRIPTQKAIDKGILTYSEFVKNENSELTTKVTPMGKIWIVNKLLSERTYKFPISKALRNLLHTKLLFKFKIEDYDKREEMICDLINHKELYDMALEMTSRSRYCNGFDGVRSNKLYHELMDLGYIFKDKIA